MRIRLLTTFCCLFAAFALRAQENIGGRPYSFDNVLMEKIDSKAMPAIDITSLKAANAVRKETGEPLQSGKILAANYTLYNSGTWSILPNGDRVWRLKIDVPGALGTSLYYKDFKLPEGAKLYIYNAEKNHLIGGYTAKNNQSHKLFATEILYSSSCIVEYYEPKRVKGKGSITISDVTHVFYVPPFVKQAKVGESGSCNVNVNCPEGSAWQNQKRSVARYLGRAGGGQFLCTGALVNNAAQNNKAYFLTADHCGGNASATDFNQWIFYFNYEAPTCANITSNPPSQTVTGAVQRARSGLGGNGDSDFQLLEITAIPSTYNVYLAGWDASGNASSSGVGIHHPAGDIKKISTYTSALTNESATHWRVYWVRTATNWGITEGGSSGSPLFNNAGNIVGDLTGGASGCGVSAANAWDVYGKVSYSWVSNGTTANRQLKPWLDPNNSGVMVLAGKNYNSGGGNVSPTVSITSPASGASFVAGSTITITANASDSDGSVTQVVFYNGSGQLGGATSSPYSYTWSNVPAGTYTITARATDNAGATTTSSPITIIVGIAPNLVDVTNSPGTITAQYTDSSPVGEEIGKVIDNNNSTKYLTFNASAWIQFRSNSSYIVTRYSLTSANDAPERDPLNWTFQGSNNGTSWVTLDSQSNQDFPNRFQRRDFSFSNSTAYSYYRLQMTNNSGNILQLAEWEILGTLVAPNLTDITNIAGGAVSAQYTDSPVGEEIAKVVDNSSSTKYLTFNASGWIQFRAASSYVVTKYSITSANDAPERDPLNWTFQGSTNGTTWVTLNTQSNQDFPNRLQRREFTFANSTAYSYYRLQMSNNSGSILQLAEWEIFGTAINSGRLDIADKSLELNKIIMYPNPARGSVNLAGIVSGSKVQIIDRQGKLMKSLEGVSDSAIDISTLKTGLYWVRVSGNGVSRVQKLVIE